MERYVNVKYINVKHNFCVVSSNLKLYFKSGNNIKISYGDKSIIMSVISGAVSGLVYDTIGLSPILGKQLNIKENELVSIKEVGNLPIITSFSVTPLNKDDYEVLETFAMDIQSTLLEQVLVINPYQKLIIYVGTNINIAVIVGDIKPTAPGTIHFLTEVVVKTHTEITKKPRQQFLPRNKSVIPEKIIFRGLPLNKLPNFNEIPNNLPFHVYTSISSLDGRFYSLSLINNHSEDNKSILYVKLIYLNSKSGQEDIFMNNLIFDYFNCEPKSRFILKLIENLPLVSNIDLIVNKSNKSSNSDLLENFRSFLAENSDDKFVLNSAIVFEFSAKSNSDEKFKCCLKFPKDTSTFCVVDNDFVRNVKYSVIEDNKLINSVTKNHKDKMDNQKNVEIYFENYFLDTKKLFNNWSELNKKPENILIVGKKGTGKSTLSKYITEKLQNYPYFLFTEIVSCKNVKGKLQESLHTKFNNIFSQLIFRQPSCLVLDDIHVICENIVGDEMAPNVVYFNRISEMLNDFLHLITTTNEISVIATTESLNKLNKNVFSSRGNHLFKSVFHIGDLNKIERKEMLKKMLSIHQLSNDINYDNLATRTEGFVMNDFHNFVNRALFEALKDTSTNDNTQISFDHCERALNSTPALSLLSVKFHTSGTKDFSNVGGLESVKKILIESLLWPVKYSSIFADAPLRLQSGILLYGPPGTGKTLLAAAAAKQCDLRLISIKGPELLSKYIGGSEQAVRDVFQKAQSAKPCILFFDEFDSLAPRRGHDNTGVTDRVVNQILTQLDGVESLTGVCVLAATSRPDLLDPALLRPGRLDRQLLCPLPNTSNREKILKALASSKGKELPLEKDVDLKWLAENTKGYSGADLQAVLYTAQLSLFDLNEKESLEESNQKITQSHLKEALKKTRPSLTASERRKYEQIYSNFQKGEMIPDGNKKVTLA